MVVSMCLIKDRNGTWIVRKKVPERLREAVSRVLDNGKQRQAFLQRSTGTKLKAEATRLAPAIMVEFAKTLQAAEALLAERPLRTVLAQTEIDRLADWHYASVLQSDEEFTINAQADEEFTRSIAAQFSAAGIENTMPFPLDDKPPAYGLSNRQLAKRAEHLTEWLPIMRSALSRGDLSMISETMAELLDRAQLNVDPNSAGYRKLGLAVLRADVRALEALERRANGEPIETPAIASQEPAAALRPTSLTVTTTSAHSAGSANLRAAGASLRDAFEGWRKERDRSGATVAGFERAITLFEELHGEAPVAEITKRHALQFREALQDIPRNRPKELAELALPALIEWRHAHPSEPVVTPATVNKLLGGVQAIAQWANRNGLIPDDVRWSDPFAGMKLLLDEQAGGPFTDEELRRLFSSPVFTAGERPEAGHGDTAFWLPLLALFTGARRSELTRRKTADITQDIATGQWLIEIYANKSAGQTLKTKGSARTLPIHPELIRLGLLDYATQQEDGWLFPHTATDKSANAWTQWFGRYLDRLGIGGGRKGLHSLRHGFKDRLRAGGVPEDLNDAITGHSNGSVGRAYGARATHHSQRHKVIVQRYGMQRLVEAVCGVQFPIDLSIIQWRC
jgi:integrase